MITAINLRLLIGYKGWGIDWKHWYLVGIVGDVVMSFREIYDSGTHSQKNYRPVEVEVRMEEVNESSLAKANEP